MDYKYIEQLLERYWNCETSIEEERILRTFFHQKDVPAHLARYQALFEYEEQNLKTELGEDFDRRLLKIAGEQEKNERRIVVKARRLTVAGRMRPLFRAAASVAIVVLLGNAAQHTFDRQQEDGAWDYTTANYHDTYQEPKEALEAGINGMEAIRELLRTQPEDADTLKKEQVDPQHKPSNRS